MTKPFHLTMADAYGDKPIMRLVADGDVVTKDLDGLVRLQDLHDEVSISLALSEKGKVNQKLVDKFLDFCRS